MNPQKDWDFKLVGMTEDMLFAELYSDIPSDSDSLVSDNYKDDEIGIDHNDNDEITIDFEDNLKINGDLVDNGVMSDTDSESNVPLSTLRGKYKQSTSARTVTSWDKNNNAASNILQFSVECGVPRFIQDINDPTPYTIFQQLLSDDFIANIVFQTNLYAEQLGKPYKPTNIVEMKTFIGMNFLMGIKPLPSYRDYWSTSKFLRDNYISHLMPVKRFSWLLTHLHLNTFQGEPGFDKLCKVRPLLTEFQTKFT